MCDGRLPKSLWLISLMAVLTVVCARRPVSTHADDPPKQSLDPAAWGSDHLHKPLPEPISGDECLFCHRKIGPHWSSNRHQQTVRPIAPDDPFVRSLLSTENDPQHRSVGAEAQYALGTQRHIRLLKRTEQFGRVALLTAHWLVAESGQGHWRELADAEWDYSKFANSCAGCHASGVDAKTGSYATLSIDCFVCHGDVQLDHASGKSEVLFGLQGDSDPRVVISACGQCHLRGGRSQSTRRPYPVRFIAGDNLFRDYRVDFSDEHLKTLNARDRHIYQNARDVVVFGDRQLTCVTCHDVHQPSSVRHQSLERTAICRTCHEADDGSWDTMPLETDRSAVCELN